jgi:DNA polymerase-3 subunit beta
MSTTFKVAKNDYLKALQVVAPAVNPKSTQPSLTYICCQVAGEKLHLTGCNFQFQIETAIIIMDADGDSVFLVDKTIIDTLKTLPEQPLEININSEKHTLFIKHSSGEITVNINPDKFDKMKNGDAKTSSFSVPAGRLLTGLEKNVKQMANDELRPVMNGIYLDIQSNGLTFAASDGHRLSKFVDNTLAGIQAESFILHRDAVPVLIKQLLMADEESDVHIRSNEKNVQFTIQDTIVSVRLIEGRYPNYNSVIPQTNDKKMSIDSKELQAILARLNTVSNSNSKLISIEAGIDRTIFYTQDIDLNKSAKEEAPYSCSSSITIGCKGTFLQELISNISGEVIFLFSDPSRAMLIQPDKQDEETEYTLILMPMMLNN